MAGNRGVPKNSWVMLTDVVAASMSAVAEPNASFPSMSTVIALPSLTIRASPVPFVTSRPVRSAVRTVIRPSAWSPSVPGTSRASQIGRPTSSTTRTRHEEGWVGCPTIPDSTRVKSPVLLVVVESTTSLVSSQSPRASTTSPASAFPVSSTTVPVTLRLTRAPPPGPQPSPSRAFAAFAAPARLRHGVASQSGERDFARQAIADAGMPGPARPDLVREHSRLGNGLRYRSNPGSASAPMQACWRSAW